MSSLLRWEGSMTEGNFACYSEDRVDMQQVSFGAVVIVSLQLATPGSLLRSCRSTVIYLILEDSSCLSSSKFSLQHRRD